MRNDQFKTVNLLFWSEISDPERKWWRHHDACNKFVSMYMINLTKSHQYRMRNDQVIDVNMLFSSKISEAERPWWRHHHVWGSSLLMYDQSYDVSSKSDEKWSRYKCKHVIFVRNQWTVKLMKTSSWRHTNGFFLDHQPSIHSIKFHKDPMTNSGVIVLTSWKKAIFTQNQWTVTSLKTSSWRHTNRFFLDH